MIISNLQIIRSIDPFRPVVHLNARRVCIRQVFRYVFQETVGHGIRVLCRHNDADDSCRFHCLRLSIRQYSWRWRGWSGRRGCSNP